MMASSDNATPADPPPLAAWRRRHGLAQPAWMVLETLRPLHWTLGQGWLLAEPLARGLGWTLDDVGGWLTGPDELHALCAALAPDEEGH